MEGEVGKSEKKLYTTSNNKMRKWVIIAAGSDVVGSKRLEFRTTCRMIL
jgi:hypothetical protein